MSLGVSKTLVAAMLLATASEAAGNENTYEEQRIEMPGEFTVYVTPDRSGTNLSVVSREIDQERHAYAFLREFDCMLVNEEGEAYAARFVGTNIEREYAELNNLSYERFSRTFPLDDLVSIIEQHQSGEENTYSANQIEHFSGIVNAWDEFGRDSMLRECGPELIS